MKKRKYILVAFIVCFVTLLAFFYKCISAYIRYSEVDPELLGSAISACNKVCIYDEEMQISLFECSDVEEIQWLSKVFIPDQGFPRWRSMEIPRYKIQFYDGSNVTVNIGLKQGLRFYWQDSSWLSCHDFFLTPESSGEILPWLCENSGKGLNELFRVSDAIKGLRPKPPPIKRETVLDIFKRKPPIPHLRELEDDDGGNVSP